MKWRCFAEQRLANRTYFQVIVKELVGLIVYSGMHSVSPKPTDSCLDFIRGTVCAAVLTGRGQNGDCAIRACDWTTKNTENAITTMATIIVTAPGLLLMLR